MSYILDALKKSENDRQRQTAPALFEVKVAEPRRKYPLWAAGLGGLLFINVVVLAWVLLRTPEPTAGVEPPVAATPALASGAPTNTAPPGMVTVPATVTIPTTVNIPIGSAPSVTVGANNPQPGVIAPSPAPPLAEDPSLSGLEPTITPEYNANDYAQAVTPAQMSAVEANRRFGGLPSRDEVLARGTRLPELRLDLHVYAAIPAERFVFINMRKLREGESLPEGVRIEAITQTGAQLSYQGTRFTLERD